MNTTTSNPTKPKKQNWYFTFGFDHYIGSECVKNKFVKIHGTFEGARLHMFERYGRKWSMQYGSAEAAGVETYKLEEIQADERPAGRIRQV